jgi:hypothetical protein
MVLVLDCRPCQAAASHVQPDPGVLLPERPISSPLTPNSLHSTSPQPQQASPATPQPHVGRITRARSAKLSQPTRPRPASISTPLQQSTAAPTARTTQPSATSPSAERSVIPPLPASLIDEQQILSQSSATQASQPILPASSSSRNLPAIPRAALEWGLQPSSHQTPLHLGNGVLQHNWIHPSARNGGIQYSPYTTPQQQDQPNNVQGPLPGTVASTPKAYNSLDRSIQAPAGERQDEHSKAAYTTGANSQEEEEEEATRVTVNPQILNDEQFSPVAAPTTPSAVNDDVSITGVPASPCQSHNATPSTPIRQPQEVPFDSPCSPSALLVSSPEPHGQSTTIEDPRVIAQASHPTTDGQSPIPRVRTPLLENDLGSLNISDTNTVRAVEVQDETIPEPWGSYMEGLKELPCMDCGEDNGHQPDCNLGSKCFDMIP